MIGDTIAAIATAAGVGAIGIVRISGPDALRIADRLFRGPGAVPPSPPLVERAVRELLVGWVHGVDMQPLDQVVLLAFPEGQSYTTEPLAEIQCHGGPAVLRAVLAAVLACGARLASPGEFTRRAFLGGRLDLAQAEAVADLTSARTDRALENAVGHLEGHLSRAVSRARAACLDVLVDLEASLDHPDELGDAPLQTAHEALARVNQDVEGWIATARAGRVVREGAHLALVGRPNVGKSSLLNALLRSDRAIVTDVPGTTRDLLEEGLELGGVPFRLVDTAGIRPATADPVEAIGIARTRERMARADLRLLVVDASTGLTEADRAIAADLGDGPVLVAVNKSDLVPDAAALAGSVGATLGVEAVAVSARDRSGVDELGARVLAQVLGSSAGPAELAVNARHEACLRRADEAVRRATATLAQGLGADFAAIDVREAVEALSAVQGQGLAEEVLDGVFARFCLGK